MNKPKKKVSWPAELLLDAPMDTADSMTPSSSPPPERDASPPPPVDAPEQAPPEQAPDSFHSFLQETIVHRDEARHAWAIVRRRWMRTGATQFDNYNALSYAVAPSISERITSRLHEADLDLQAARAELVFWQRKSSLIACVILLARKSLRNIKYVHCHARALTRLSQFLSRERNRKLSSDADVPFARVDAIATIGENMGLAQAYGWVHYNSI